MCTSDELLLDRELILFSPVGKKYENEIDIIFIVCLFIVYFLYSGGDISSPGIIDVVKYINTTGTAFCYFPPFLLGNRPQIFEQKRNIFKLVRTGSKCTFAIEKERRENKPAKSNRVSLDGLVEQFI